MVVLCMSNLVSVDFIGALLTLKAPFIWELADSCGFRLEGQRRLRVAVS